ncbi:MAG: hypothetical protein GC136_06320 [Alphaproteobacteria bacterium]|nr:hypothetical protein [Alphaproteobacteria bacterium]
MTREDLLLASTFGIFEVKYKVRANAESEWQERCYTIAHMAGVALADTKDASELLIMACRSPHWQQFSSSCETTADYIFASTQVVMDLTVADDKNLEEVLSNHLQEKISDVHLYSLKNGFSNCIEVRDDKSRIHINSLEEGWAKSSNVDIHQDAGMRTIELRCTNTISATDEEAATVFYPEFRRDQSRHWNSFNINELDQYFFRGLNNRRCYFVIGALPLKPGTYHSAVHTQSARVTGIATSEPTCNLEFSDVEITQVGWDRRPAGLDAMLANEKYMGAKSYLLKPDIK